MSNPRIFGRAIAALAIPASLAIAAPAMAGSDIVVSYSDNGAAVTQAKPVDISDLRLSSAQGRYLAKQRIMDAVKTVCSQDKAVGVSGQSDYQRCVNAAQSKAMADAGLTRTRIASR
ncbi:MAG: UrcA family protein [Pseudomonadota bacterium]|jgi:UrcA family protein|tara:strand:- start:149 stop:499 length:351 start_codon:yes stop_codon:yes gene_type:complete